MSSGRRYHQLLPCLHHLFHSLAADTHLDHLYIVVVLAVVGRRDLAHNLLVVLLDQERRLVDCCIRRAIWMAKSLLKQMDRVGDMLDVRLLRFQEEEGIANALVAVDNHQLN